VQFEAELQRLLSQADQAIGRLDCVTSRLPNPDIFVAMYVRQEAVLSSQIEGIQSPLDTLDNIFSLFFSVFSVPLWLIIFI